MIENTRAYCGACVCMIIINTRNNYKYKVLIIFMDYTSSYRKEERKREREREREREKVRKSEEISTKFCPSLFP